VRNASGPTAQRAAAAAAAAAAATAAPPSAEAAREDPNVDALLGFGYPLDHALAALKEAGGSLPAAAAALFAALIPADAADGGGAAAAAGLVAAFAGGPAAERTPRPTAWAEEREALEAIYGPEVAFPEAGRAVLTLDWPEARDVVKLHVWCPPEVGGGGGGQTYPDVPPAVGVECARVAPAARLRLAARLASEAARLAAGGHSAVHDLGVALSEALEEGGEQLLTGGRRGRAPAPYDRPLGAPAGAADGKAAAAEAGGSAAACGGAAADEACERERPAARPPAAAVPRRRQRPPPPSPEVVAAESARLLREHERLQVRGPGSSAAAALAAHVLALPFPPQPLQLADCPPPYPGTQSDASHASMRAVRAALPAASKRAELLAAAAAADVLVISGATGCGKSTQVRPHARAPVHERTCTPPLLLARLPVPRLHPTLLPSHPHPNPTQHTPTPTPNPPPRPRSHSTCWRRPSPPAAAGPPPSSSPSRAASLQPASRRASHRSAARSSAASWATACVSTAAPARGRASCSAPRVRAGVAGTGPGTTWQLALPPHGPTPLPPCAPHAPNRTHA
jgi:hypothetical protein